MTEINKTFPKAIAGQYLFHDINKDKKADLITATTTENGDRVTTKVNLSLANKKGDFVNDRVILTIDPDEESEDFKIAVADINGDGKLDICLDSLSPEGYHLKCWLNDLNLGKKTKKKTIKTIKDDYDSYSLPPLRKK